MKRLIALGMICIGVLLISIGLEMFLTPHKILPGGIKGVAILLSHVTEMKMGLILLYINLPFVIFKRRSLRQTLLALAALVLISFISIYLHPFPPISADPLTAAISGGILFGLGAGLIVRYGWYADGVNEIALFLRKKVRRLSVAEVIMILNILMLSCGGFLFGWDQALYSIIAYFLAYKSIQFALDFRRTKLIWLSSESCAVIVERLREVLKPDIQIMPREEVEPGGHAIAGIGVIAEKGAARSPGTCCSASNEAFLLLPARHIRKFKAIVQQLDPSAVVTISYAGRVHSEAFYRM
jgi:uncharacterized membrane-anchored protein YitT (DUF2179 family)